MLKRDYVVFAVGHEGHIQGLAGAGVEHPKTSGAGAVFRNGIAVIGIEVFRHHAARTTSTGPTSAAATGARKTQKAVEGGLCWRGGQESRPAGHEQSRSPGNQTIR